MDPSSHPLIASLRTHGPISGEEERVLLASIGPPRYVPIREDIVSEGDSPKESTVLLEGIAARYKHDERGNRRIIALHIPGDFVDLHSFLLPEIDHGIIAMTGCKVAGVPHRSINFLIDNHRGLARLFWLSTLVDASVHRAWLARFGAEAYGRTAGLICEMYLRLKSIGQAEGKSIRLPLTQNDVGDILKLSTVHVNRTIQALRHDGLVAWRGGVITIIDFEKLTAAAGFEARYLYMIEPTNVPDEVAR